MAARRVRPWSRSSSCSVRLGKGRVTDWKWPLVEAGVEDQQLATPALL